MKHWERKEPIANAHVLQNGEIFSDMGHIIFNQDGFNVIRTTLTPEGFAALRETIFELIKEKQEYYESETIKN